MNKTIIENVQKVVNKKVKFFQKDNNFSLTLILLK